MSTELRRKRRSSNLCVICGDPSDTYTCPKCRIIKQQQAILRRKIRKANNTCYYCSNSVVEGKTFCLKHYLCEVARDGLGDYKKGYLLEELMKNQSYRCALTGIGLRWNDKIELDHIVPLSRGGTKDISNVRWILKTINRMKHNLTDSEFKSIVELILSYGGLVN